MERLGASLEKENNDLILESLLRCLVRSFTGSSNSKLIDHCVGMGFPKELIAKVIQENGEGNAVPTSPLKSLINPSFTQSGT